MQSRRSSNPVASVVFSTSIASYVAKEIEEPTLARPAAAATIPGLHERLCHRHARQASTSAAAATLTSDTTMRTPTLQPAQPQMNCPWPLATAREYTSTNNSCSQGPASAARLLIILSQEKNIQQLNQLIESLQRQLLHCRGSNNTVHAATTAAAATEVSEVEGHEGNEIIEDENRR